MLSGISITCFAASYTVALLLVRTMWLIQQGLRHLRFADFSMITGRSGYLMWRLGLVSLWLKLFGPNVRRAAERGGWRVPERLPESNP